MQPHRRAHDIAGSLAPVLWTAFREEPGQARRDGVDLVAGEELRQCDHAVAVEFLELIVGQFVNEGLQPFHAPPLPQLHRLATFARGSIAILGRASGLR